MTIIKSLKAGNAFFLNNFVRESQFLTNGLGRISRAYFHGDQQLPPHFAYRGTGLPSVKCAEVQEIVHINDRQTLKAKEPLRPSKEALGTYECSVEGTSIEIFNEMKELHDRVLASNWHDTVQLIMNADIWDANLCRLDKKARDIPDLQVQTMLNELLTLFDVLYQVEDIQDHIFELAEDFNVNIRLATDPDMSIYITPNLNQQIEHIYETSNKLKELYPKYTAKIQDTIGYSLATFRQKYSFKWPDEHKYFY